jgi:hypothetical protein
MARRKYFSHEYAADRGRVTVNRINSRSKPKDKSFRARAKVSQISIDCSINRIKKNKGIYFLAYSEEIFNTDIIKNIKN